MRLAIESREKALQAYLDLVKSSAIPAELQSHLRVYGVVQICGYLERCMELITLERLHARAHPRILEFIKSQCKYGTNFRCPVIKSFLDRFDLEWGRAFQLFIDQNDDVKEGVESAYAIRNQAAHGNSTNVGEQRVQELFDLAKRAVQGLVSATSS